MRINTECACCLAVRVRGVFSHARVRFEINDSDGLHQAQLYIPTTDRDPVEGSGFKLHSCRSLSGEVSTLEFITTELPEEDAFVRLRVMDIRGNFKWWKHYFPIQATDILRKSANLVGAVDATGTVPGTLWKISGDQQHGSLNNRLANPFVVAVRDGDDEPVAGVQVTFRITKGSGKLSTINPWTDSNGHARTFLTLGGSRINRVVASVSGVSERVTFSTDSEPQVLVPRSQRPPMYWVDAGTGTLHRLVGSKVENLVPSVRNTISLVVDMADEKLYWAERTGNRTGRIRRANLDGTNVQLVKSHNNRCCTCNNGSPRSNFASIQLSQSIQPRDMDTVSVVKTCRGNAAYLCGKRAGSSMVGVGASACGNVSEQKPCRVLEWKK